VVKIKSKSKNWGKFVMNYRVGKVDLEKKVFEVEEFDLNEVSGPVEAGVYLHLRKFSTWQRDLMDPANGIFIGTGPFAGSKIFGSHRVVAVFRSPETGGLHISELGGAGFKTIRAGIHGIFLKGRAPKPCIVFVESQGNQVKCSFEYIDFEELQSIYHGYKGYKGVYGFTKYLVEKYNEFFVKNDARAIVVGEGAWSTRFGSLVSIDVNPKEKDLIPGSEDFAGRGGGGSVLAQVHQVAAIVMGGAWKPDLPEVLTSIKKFNEVFKRVTGRDYLKAVTSSTVKYRFNPKVGAGGTFGSNYPHYKEWLLTFCYNSIYLKKEFRKKITQLILEHYWKPFKEEVFEKAKPWKTCGEPCPVACKKLWKTKKVDYEPFQGIGPLIGVFNLDLAARIVDEIDGKGLDAIATGHMVMFFLEAVDKGLLTPEEVGLSQKPYLNPFVLNPKVWEINGYLAIEIIKGLVSRKTEALALVAEKGLRKAAEELSLKYEERVAKAGFSFKDIAIYQPYGETGYMTPNFYWTKGFLVPIFVTGKYWTEYSLVFENPEEFARHVYERILKEMGVSNAGLCRFHRGWVENFLPELYRLLGVEGYEERLRKTYREIGCYAIKCGAVPKPLEGDKAIDLIALLAEELGVHEWASKFQKNKLRAYFEWFERFYTTYLGYVGLIGEEC